MHAVSLTPHARVHAVSLTPHVRCMRCHLHRMHGTCGVSDTACKKICLNNIEKLKSHAKQQWYAEKINACGIIDTACKI
jgi:hypothetical protein